MKRKEIQSIVDNFENLDEKSDMSINKKFPN